MPRPIQSIERASAILRLLSGRTRRLSLTEIAGELRLPKGTAYGILRTLLSVGFVEQDPESARYRMGAALLHLGSSYLDENELRARALNWSDWLAAKTNETVRLGTLHDAQVLVVHHVFRPDNSPHALEIGRLLPVHATALGKVLLAHHSYLADAVANDGPFPRITDSTITDLKLLASEVDRVRDQGWAAEVSELIDGEAACAAPIRDRRGIAIGAVGVSGPVERICEGLQLRTDIVTLVREAARTISRDLGSLPW
jgi:DNA-binding IclR family transcriptional regulator